VIGKVVATLVAARVVPASGMIWDARRHPHCDSRTSPWSSLQPKWHEAWQAVLCLN
jgi:hypothetical protein